MDAAAADPYPGATEAGSTGGFLEALYAQHTMEFKVIETIGTSNESIQARKMRLQLEDMCQDIVANDAAILKITTAAWRFLFLKLQRQKKFLV